MQHAVAELPTFPGNDESPFFKVVTAYEDLQSGKRARRTYDFVASSLVQTCQCTNQMWKFSVLGIPRMRELAARDAETADLIIISCQAGGDFPMDLKAWIECWLAGPTNAMALVGLFNWVSKEARSTWEQRTYLAVVAQRAGVELFVQPDERHAQLPDAQPEQIGNTSGLIINDRALNTLSRAAEEALLSPRWGINE